MTLSSTTGVTVISNSKPARFHRGDLTRAYPELPDYLTLDDAHAIIEAARVDQREQGSFRDALLFELLWRTGMRISEALSFTLNMVRENDIRIKGKGGKIRIIPLDPITITNLYAHAMYNKISVETPLFNISRSQAHRLLNKYAKAAGITRPVHCHLFRHGFAVNFLRQTGNIVYLQDLLGHSSIETTRIYVRAALPDVREAIAKVEF